MEGQSGDLVPLLSKSPGPCLAPELLATLLIQRLESMTSICQLIPPSPVEKENRTSSGSARILPEKYPSLLQI